MNRFHCRGLLLAAVFVSTSCFAPEAEGYQRTPARAAAFLADAESRLMDLGIELERAQWVQQTHITEDTETLAALAYERFIEAQMAYAKDAARFDGLDLPVEDARKLKLLMTAIRLPAPDNDELRQELTSIAASLKSAYGKGQYCPEDGECRDLGALSRTMAESQDPAELRQAWLGWRTISPPMREDYRRFAELANQGAKELGFDDLGALWRSGYDMPPDEFSDELDRLWGQVRPLYEKLHCFVRARLSKRYGPELVPLDKPIPAHLLGNMWAQTWANVYDLVSPADADPGFDLTKLLRDQGMDELKMVRRGEAFFTSLGFEPLPETFWQRSQFNKPPDREVVCHASAWDIDMVDDLRIKMCIEINAEDFSTIHHELGHNFYQRAYSDQPLLFRESANDGFHEGIGDTVSLSVTPGYLVEIGLLDREPEATKDIGVLLKMALDKIAFLPFGLVVDGWRWQVFSGETDVDDFNRAWWDLRLKYQGIKPPVERTEEDFDPGAKYHVPANTPYTRYFLAHILQFQFHRSLCETAGYEGALHRCSIYGNAGAGARLAELLEMGASRPWPEALAALTGQREMDATAVLDYFAPLEKWLDSQNKGLTCGW